jgi:uncharacterized protein (DUF488 family)
MLYLQNGGIMRAYTIGHSTHPIEKFIKLLKDAGIDTIVDVRSVPYSQYSPQYNRENIKVELQNNNINYIFMGDELGARHVEPEVLDGDGRVIFDKVRMLDSFKKGIKRVISGLGKGYSIALMCTEKNPFECHRFSLVSYALKKEGVSISHILEDGTLKENEELEQAFISKAPDLFKTKDQEIEEGYKKIESKVAFVKEDGK